MKETAILYVSNAEIEKLVYCVTHYPEKRAEV